MKKLFLFSIIALLFSVTIGCEKEGKPQVKSEMKKGRIVGYLNCSEEMDNIENIFLGVYVISDDKKDSLLILNMPSQFVSHIDKYKDFRNFHPWNGDRKPIVGVPISFSYRLAKKDEQKKIYCPPCYYGIIYPCYDTSMFKQAVITEIKGVE